MSDLESLLTKQAASQRMAAAGIDATATPFYVRHKPGETTIVAYNFELPNGDTTLGYVRWCQDPQRAAQKYRKTFKRQPRPSLISSGLDKLDAHTVLYSFPNDARLRRLVCYSDSAELDDSLTELVAAGDRITATGSAVEVLRYKPERRIVNHLSLRTEQGMTNEVLLRYTTAPHADQMHRLSSHLRANGVATPAPIACLDDGRVSIDEFIDGHQLRAAIAAGSVPVADVVDAIGTFHSTRLPPAALPRTSDDELARSTSGLGGLAKWRPNLAALAKHTMQLLVATQPAQGSEPRLLHGDLHPENLIHTSTEVSFVDLERICIGDPAIDIGYFLAHGIARPIRDPNEPAGATDFAYETVELYRTRCNAISDQTLGWHTAIGVVDQALVVARHLETDWATTTRHLLETACALLNTSPTAARTLAL